MTGLIAQNLCHTTQGSEFTITGRGGLPTPPNAALNGNNTWEDWRIGEASETSTSNPKTSNTPETIVEAQGWYKDANGNIILTAKTTTVTPQSNWLKFPNCQP
ncbi:MAG TPA: hypothetical protein DDW76_21460 [Cyanobacteria bacterium UBA11369]|nr:hypothetical protein [Cyanobacteria bacterium UBA11371]HBE35991.1 hypothetical protein [Cyanobacteria bacterium UBA11368]HBE51268.1 hypothetical protein [Cyanobacteria bacterium UBA11369]